MSPSHRRRWRGLAGAALDAAFVFTLFAAVFGAFSLANAVRGSWRGAPEQPVFVAGYRT